jgi:ATP-binding cassette subfamily B protein
MRRIFAACLRPFLGITSVWLVLRATGLAVGLLIEELFNLVAGSSHGALIWWLLAALAGTELARIVLWYGVVLSRMEPGFTYRMRSRLRANLLDGVLARPAGVALRHPPGDVVSRLGDDVDEVGVFAIWSASNISRVVIAVAAIAIMLTVDPVVTAALVAPVVLIMLVGRQLSNRIGKARAASRKAGSQVSTIVGEAMTGVQAVKVGRAEQRVVGRLSAAGDVRLKAAVRVELLSAMQGALFTNTGAIAVGLVLLVAAGRMRSGSFTVGDLALFTTYIQFVSDAVNALGAFMTRARRASVSLGRIAEITGSVTDTVRVTPTYIDAVMPPAPVQPDAPGPEFRSLLAQGLTVRHGARRGVFDVDVEVRAGRLTVVTGRVGSGKSTLVRALIGLLPADEGQISWNGEPVDDPPGYFVPPRIGYVPQVPRLFSGTLRENVLLGLDRDDDEVLAALRTAAFDEDLARMSDGLDTVVGVRGLRLSGGQAHRVATARSLIREPQLLVCDDLSNALDVNTEREIWDRILADGRSVLAVSHRAPVLNRADEVILLADGARIAQGPLATLLDQHQHMRELMYSDDVPQAQAGAG